MTEINPFAAVGYSSNPAAILRRYAFERAIPAVSKAPAVGGVLGARSGSEIGPDVVETIEISMVHHVGGIAAGYHFPNDPVSVEQHPVYLDLMVTQTRRTCRASCITSVPAREFTEVPEMLERSAAPRERSRCRVIVQALAQILNWWQDAVNHGSLQHRFLGQGSAAGDTAALPVYMVTI